MKRFKRWWSAYVMDWPYWRVTYKDGKRTSLLSHAEAYGLSKTFNGKLWIDYDVPNINQ